MIEVSDAVEQLTCAVADLQRRVGILEGASRVELPAPAQPTPPATALPAVEPRALPAGTAIFLVLGKAMLAIAGAYLLRALAESSAVPRTPVIAISILYAFVWLIPATRAAAKAWFASSVWAGTSALILIPMLWELTLRFRFLPDALAAAVLGAFVVAASALAWKHHFAAVAWVADVAGSIAALILAIATRDPAPFIVALLIMASVGEIAAARNRTLRVRPLVAAAANFATFALIWIYSSPAGSWAEYAPIGATALLAFGPVLLLIYAASATTQTMLLGRRISFFETAQTLIAFLLACWSVFSFWSGPGAVFLGILCLLAAAAGYALVFAWFGRFHAQRNYHVYATGSLALFLVGCWLCLPPAVLALSLSLAAILATLLGVRTARITLQFHGLACIAAAAFSSGLVAWIARAMTGALPSSPGWIVFLVSASSVICYLALPRSNPESGDRWWTRLLRLLAAALAAAASASLLVWLLLRLTAVAVVPYASHIAVIRTLITCALALGLASSGALWQRIELAWLAWAALAFGASKLLFEDLRHGRLVFTAASLFLYAVTLLLIPRLTHPKPKHGKAA